MPLIKRHKMGTGTAVTEEECESNIPISLTNKMNEKSGEELDGLSTAVFVCSANPIHSTPPSSSILSSCYYYLPFDGTVRPLSSDVVGNTEFHEISSHVLYSPQESSEDFGSSAVTNKIKRISRTASLTAGFKNDYEEEYRPDLVYRSSGSSSNASNAEFSSDSSLCHRESSPCVSFTAVVPPIQNEVDLGNNVPPSWNMHHMPPYPYSIVESRTADSAEFLAVIDGDYGISSGMFESTLPSFFEHCSTG